MNLQQAQYKNCGACEFAPHLPESPETPEMNPGSPIQKALEIKIKNKKGHLPFKGATFTKNEKD
ncbi:hypothetical protein [Dialister sp.]|uniref:hypothetical protein n=1 Tax=Dialister sp. TaxID=1955814 RepID=UPI002E818378|nr:hypothetical protein [Dialister sp.]MEE3453548.1 hypothetical protein [Dialister sp.]